MMRKVSSCLTACIAAVLFAAIAPAAPVTDVTWSFGATIPNAHQEAAVAVASGKLYVIAGADLSCSDSGGAGTTTNAVDIYDPATNSFSSGPAVNFARAEYPLAARAGSNIFLLGGTSTCAGATETTVEELNLKANVWTALPSTSNLPAPLDGAEHCGAAVNGKIYYFQAAGIGVFDTSTLTWTVLPANPLLNPSSFCQATATADTIVITGPGNGSSDANSQRVLGFNTITGVLSARTPLDTASLAEHFAFNVHGSVIVGGGDFADTTVQSIAPRSITYLSPLPAIVDDEVGGEIGGLLYLAGGNNGSSSTPPVLIGTPVF